MAIFNGTSGNDTLDGSLGSVNDALNGGLGDDLYRYNVGSGNDVITDTGGADTLQLGDPNNLHPSWNFYRSGANGKDLVIDFYGQGRITVINQFLGSPIVETLAFADEWESYPFANGVTGAAGNDLLVGTSMAETINGNAGDDLIFAGAGNDTILGGDGDDEIHDGLGNDSIVGGGGDDWIEVDGGSNIIDGGTGRDETSYINATQGVIVNLSGQVQGNLADGHVLKSIGVEDTLTSIESVYGSDFADVFFGGRTTGEGYFNAGQVEFIGGGGNDTFYVGSGLNGDGAWANVEYGDDQAGVIVNLSDASITVNGVMVASKTARDGTGGTDTFVLSGDRLGIHGSDFNDYIQGQSSVNNVWLNGGAGNDTIVGGSSLHDHTGYDSGDDRAIYGAIVNLSASAITVTSITGVTGVTSSVTVSANHARDPYGDTDTLQNIEGFGGSSLNDYIVGGINGNWLGGKEGNDTLIGGAGENRIEGDDGNDKLIGGASGDWLFAGAGNDTLDGGAGIDTMTGGDGSDTYYVRNIGDLVIESNAIASFGGTDHVHSYLAAYTLTDNVENGRIRSTTAANLTGNTLNNVLYAGAGNNVLNGGSGTDTVSYAYGLAGSTGVTVSLAVSTAQATGGSGSDTLLSIEKLIGSAYADKLTGNTGANSLSGAAGNDTLDGGAGIDTMTGGDGSDTYYVRDIGDIVSETNAVASTGGTDLVHSYLAAYTLTNNVENGRILSTAAANLTGNTLNNVLYAGAGNNVLNGDSGIDTVSYAYGLTGTTGVTVNLSSTTAQATGGSGTDSLLSIENLIGSAYADKLTGNTGANSLAGNAGNDSLDGGAGIDTMTGGDGSDTYYVRDVGDLVSETNAVASTGGTDHVHSYLAAYTLTANVENGRILATGTASLTGNTLNNVLYAGAGDNVLNGFSGIDTVSYQYATTSVSVSLATSAAQSTGGSGSDTLQNIDNLTGSSFHDTLIGDGNANTLNGLALNDSLNGGGGNDVLLGGDGTDLLIGGLGKDLLTGGAGNDTFDFNAVNETGLTSTTWDVISDFLSGTDKIDLSSIDANTGVALDQAFSAVVVGGTFSGAFASPGDLYFDQVAHVLYGNTDSDAAAEFAIQLTGVTTLATADFFL